VVDRSQAGDSPVGALPGNEHDEPEMLGASEPLPAERPERQRRNGNKASLPRLGRRALLVVVLLIALALAPSFASTLKKTPTDRIGISYGGGPIEGDHYQRTIEPGSNLFFNGWFDKLYLYPSDQINYIISDDGGGRSDDEAPSTNLVVAPTSDRVQISYQVAIYFKLNTDLLQDFHEQLGLRYAAYTTDGWNRLLSDTIRQQLENTLQEETRQIAVADLIGNADLLVQLQDNVQTKLSERLEDALGERYFCSPTFDPGGDCGDPSFVIKEVGMPDSVAQAFEDVRTSDINVETRQNEVRQRQAEAQAIDALGLTGQEYTILKAIEAGNIKFWVLPNESGVTITGPDAAGGGGEAPPEGGG
jgi:regulator of protease activity HflC (stomatin/prohibitin superfamily)